MFHQLSMLVVSDDGVHSIIPQLILLFISIRLFLFICTSLLSFTIRLLLHHDHVVMGLPDECLHDGVTVPTLYPHVLPQHLIGATPLLLNTTFVLS